MSITHLHHAWSKGHRLHFLCRSVGKHWQHMVNGSQSRKNRRSWVRWMWEPFEIHKEVLGQCFTFSFGAACLDDGTRLLLGFHFFVFVFVKELSYWNSFHKIYWRTVLINVPCHYWRWNCFLICKQFISSLNQVRGGESLSDLSSFRLVSKHLILIPMSFPWREQL